VRSTFVLSLCQSFEAGDCLVADWGLVERSEDSERIDEGGDFVGVAAEAFEVEDAFADLDEEVVLVIHLFDDFDEVGDELILDPAMACLVCDVPRTDPMREILVAALSFREGLSLFSSSI
jgi:hypothetical protein